MALTTTQITGRIAAANEQIPANTRVEFTLTGYDTDDANDTTVIPSTVVAELDVNGDIDVSLLRNTSGDRGRFYRVRVVTEMADGPVTYSLDTIEVPASGTFDLNDLVAIGTPPSLSIQEYLAQIQNSVAQVKSLTDDLTVEQIYTGTVGGTANAITLTTGESLIAYTPGYVFYLRAGFDNTGFVTINVDGLGAITLNTKENDTLLPGMLVDGRRYAVLIETATRALLIDTSRVEFERLQAIEDDAADTKEKLSILTPEQGVDADAAAWLAAVTGSVTPSVQSLVVSAISQLKETGVWSALDVINVDLGVSEQAALINLKDPTNIHTNNGATYVRGQGFKGNGVDAWIDTGLDVTTLAGYSQSDAHLGSWETEDIAATGRSIGTSGAISAYISGRLAGGSLSARINDATAEAVAVDTSLGFSGVNRSGATARELYRNGVLVASDAEASTSIVGTGNISVLRSNILYSERRVWAYTAGSSLTAAQWGSLFAILNNVRDKVVDSISLAPTEARLVVQTVPVVANAITVSMDDGHAVEVPLDANVTTVTVTDWPQSVAQVRFYFTQDATGGRTVTFPGGWIGTASPSATANFVTEIIAESLDGGATIRLKQGETWNG